MKVRALKEYYDLELKKIINPDDEFEVSEDRAKELAGSDNKAKQPLVDILEATPPTSKKSARGKKKAED